MKKKLSLEVDFSDEYIIIGISSNLKIYKLAWSLNKVMNLQLKKVKDLLVENHKEKTNSKFTMYSFKDVKLDNIFYLISNRSENSAMFQDYKNIDYFLIIRGQFEDNIISNNIDIIKQINNIFAIYLIESEDIKNINIVLSEIEIQIK